MKNRTIKTLIAVGCLTLCEFAFAGVGVRIFVKNSTGADLTSVGACFHSKDSGVCKYTPFTVPAWAEVQVAYTELYNGWKLFDQTFDIADNTSYYFCTTHIQGKTGFRNTQPSIVSNLVSSTDPVENAYVINACNGTSIVKGSNNGDTVEIHIEALPKTLRTIR